ncbi:MAG TPA: NADP transhydrogenase subunit alpha [Thermoflexia bacterium]|nr:NADP transhydrogenase subunit alpha [Thermoflexia bacterium]
MNTDKPHITVIGAGHGGKAMSAEMAARGFPVTLYNRTFEHIEVIKLCGGIELLTEESRQVFGPLQRVTADMEEALSDAELIMVVIPSSGHRSVALTAAPHLRDGQTVVLNPGRTGGALEFIQGLREGGCSSYPTICEAETFLFASRSIGPAEARIFRTKYSVPVAALPATRTEEALALLQRVYPQFIPAANILHTSLNNMGAIFHPALTLLNAGRIESTQGNFEFYMEGVTPSTAKILEALDRERVTVASALGIRAQTAQEWLYRAYAAEGDNLHAAMHANPGYKGIKAPNRLQHRYLFEEIPCSLVPIVAIGKQYGVDAPTMRALIHLANIIHGADYWRRGRTLERLGIKGMSVQELHTYVETGQRDRPVRG